MKIYNGTQHAIHFYSINDTVSIQDGRKLVRKEGASPILTLDKGTNLNAVKGNLPAPQFPDCPFPVVGAVSFLDADPLPEGYDVYVVSQIFRAAYKELGLDTSRLAVVDGAVYEDESAVRPCGVLRLAIG